MKHFGRTFFWEKIWGPFLGDFMDFDECFTNLAGFFFSCFSSLNNSSSNPIRNIAAYLFSNLSV